MAVTTQTETEITSEVIQRLPKPKGITFKGQKTPSKVIVREKPGETTSAWQRSRPRMLRTWSELADWQKTETKIIYSGYRKPTPSILGCVKSWFYIHNETMNILTHLIGSLLFVGLAFYLYRDLTVKYATWSTGDVVCIGVFMFGVATCFALSATFHTLASHSHEVYHIARRLDFQGIIILVLATSAPQTYYTFYGESTLRYRYWTVICTFGLFASIMTFMPTFQKPERNSVRVGVFAGLGLSTFAPILHGCLLHGIQGQALRFPLGLLALTHGCNLFGAFVYVTHFPERWWPGRFDLFGASHQLMHTAIVGAAISLLAGSLIAFDNMHIKSG